ncbi:hypothetical protein BN1050_00470 [Metalysinibacillus saudimassiliensis]|uniref:DUF1033 domain-containing protein n=1 Tax=Metalysinibacillus saudimassiliensis TaxID=1461583 RepID=A0A078LYG3_9BACL|nr:hypothetical protein BN1050_00470 [Metalysinibacillus saudimassiliensis]
MYKVIYMKADYEPWWQFEGWEQTIEQQKTFSTIEEAQKNLEQQLVDFRANYNNEQSKDGMFAFWCEDEISYCEACEDDAQIYHGLFIQKIY